MASIRSAGNQCASSSVQRRSEPGDGQVGVDERARPLGERHVAGVDAGAGVDQGHVEVEADGERGEDAGEAMDVICTIVRDAAFA